MKWKNMFTRNRKFLKMSYLGLASIVLMTACCTSISDSRFNDGDGYDNRRDAGLFYKCSEKNVLCKQPYCEQVLVRPGFFYMGSNYQPSWKPSGIFGGLDTLGIETPVHMVYLDAFCIDKYEVTYKRYHACVAARVCRPEGHGATKSQNIVYGHYPGFCGKDIMKNCSNLAVNCRSYEHASTYCRWIGRRLCTEAEWERSAGGPGPEKLKFPWGNTETYNSANRKLPNIISYVERVDGRPSGVSSEGIHGLIGNIFEWVSDYYEAYKPTSKNSVSNNPGGPSTGKYRIGRGGCAFLGGQETITTRVTMRPDFDYG